MSLIDRIKYEQRTLLSFCHGLGDTILFLPIYHEIQKQTNKRIELGVHKKLSGTMGKERRILFYSAKVDLLLI